MPEAIQSKKQVAIADLARLNPSFVGMVETNNPWRPTLHRAFVPPSVLFGHTSSTFRPTVPLIQTFQKPLVNNQVVSFSLLMEHTVVVSPLVQWTTLADGALKSFNSDKGYHSPL